MSDDFEARNMRDGAPVVHSDKRVSRGLTAIVSGSGLLTMALALFIAFANATSHKPVPVGALPLVVGAIGMLGMGLVVLGVVMGVVRTVVSEREVNVKFGLWGPRIPLENIRSASVVDYDWTAFGGWGIRRSVDGTWAYVPGGKRVLEIRYVEDGKERRVLVGADNPEETARQIDRARRPHVRVADFAKPAQLVEQTSIDEEAEADAGDEREKRAR